VILFVVSYLAGVLTIVSPCILPVLPFVFASADRPFVKSGLPLLVGMAVTFTLVATLAAVGGSFVVTAINMGGSSPSFFSPSSARRCCSRNWPTG